VAQLNRRRHPTAPQRDRAGSEFHVRDEARGRPIPPVQTMKSSAPKPMTAKDWEQFEQFRKLLGPPKISPPYDRLPAELQKLDVWARFHPKPSAGNDFWPEELQQMYEETQQHPSPLGDLPLMVLVPESREEAPPPFGLSVEEWKRISEEKRQQKEAQARLSRNGKFVVVTESGHPIHLDQPARVVDAIRQVVEAARHHTRLANGYVSGRLTRKLAASRK
jgi:pimeloyl-ACP methyl ester carboxylesterase